MNMDVEQSPKPGEIWEISRSVLSPLSISQQELSWYSDPARRFLLGNSPPYYVMIVKEPERPVEEEIEWQIVSVMLLGVQTDFLSNVDILIPSEISGVGRDLLAETWHVQSMLTCNLSRRVGQRLSRNIYDVLMSVGDFDRGLVDEPPSPQEIELLGLKVGTLDPQQQEIQQFHQQEVAMTDVLKVPLAAYGTYLKGMEFTDTLLDEALQLELELAKLAEETVFSNHPNRSKENDEH